jgi:hypothetical protein
VSVMTVLAEKEAQRSEARAIQEIGFKKPV